MATNELEMKPVKGNTNTNNWTHAAIWLNINIWLYKHLKHLTFQTLATFSTFVHLTIYHLDGSVGEAAWEIVRCPSVSLHGSLSCHAHLLFTLTPGVGTYIHPFQQSTSLVWHCPVQDDIHSFFMMWLHWSFSWLWRLNFTVSINIPAQRFFSKLGHVSQDVSDVSCGSTELCVANGWDREYTGSDGNTKHKGLASFCASNTETQTDLWSHETIFIEILLKFLQQVSVLKHSPALKVCSSLIWSGIVGHPAPLFRHMGVVWQACCDSFINVSFW